MALAQKGQCHSIKMLSPFLGKIFLKKIFFF
nr:MAG TPA: hypothetical protein [Caudoviricetes sp.]